MADHIRTVHITVEVQENGIVRDAKGTIIARLSEDANNALWFEYFTEGEQNGG